MPIENNIIIIMIYAPVLSACMYLNEHEMHTIYRNIIQPLYFYLYKHTFM